MSLSQMKVFSDYIMPATIETLSQMIEKFNQASNGAIRLTTTAVDGDFFQESFFKSVHSAQRRVDRNTAQGAVTPTDLTQDQYNSVKIAGGFGPIRYEPSQMTWLNQPTALGIEVASRNFAEALLSDQLNTAIAALVAAISGQVAAANIDISGVASPGGALSQVSLNNAHALFGDNSQNLITQVMSGSANHRLIGAALQNGAQLFSSGNVRVIDILGKTTIVTDSPSLYVVGTPNKHRVLSLTESAAIVSNSSDIISNINTNNGQTRIETTMQVDYSFVLGLKGYAWDVTNGGKSPTDAEIATATNWDKVASSIKHTAGVMTTASADQ